MRAMTVDLEFYRAPGPMTDLAGIDDEYFATLTDAEAVTGLMPDPAYLPSGYFLPAGAG